MTRSRFPLVMFTFFVLALGMAPASFGLGLDVRGSYVPISMIDCTGLLSTHDFFKDGRAHYGIDGSCLVRSYKNTIVKYHVDGNWTPNPSSRGHATETGRIYGLGNIDPIMFTPGDPNDPNNYTVFVNGMSCTKDPWLSGNSCTLENYGPTPELDKLVPGMKYGPFPLTKDAIPAAQQAALDKEYVKVTTGLTPITPQAQALKSSAGRVQLNLTPPYGASYGPGPLSSLARGQTTAVTIQVVNTGSLTWTPSAPNPFHLSYHWYNAGSVGAGSAPKALAVVWDGLRTNLPGPIGPNQTTLSPLNANVQAPLAAGTYVLKWDMVQEGSPVTWFSQNQVPTGDQTVVVK